MEKISQRKESLPLKEHQMVILNSVFEEIPAGTKGTVVFVYPDEQTYEVEFLVEGTSEVKTIFAEQLSRL